MKINAKEWFNQWGVWPMGGGVDPPPSEPPAAEPPVEPPAPAPPTAQPAISMDTKLDGDQIPEELRGKSLTEIINLLQQPKSEQTPPSAGQKSEADQLEELRASYYRDPIATTMELVRVAIAPVLENIYNDRSEKGRAVIASNPDYELLKEDVDDFMTHVPSNLKADPKAWDIAYNYAKGKNFDKLASRGQAPPVPPANLPPPTGGAGAAVAVEVSKEEEAIAAKFGMTKEQWVEAKKL